MANRHPLNPAGYDPEEAWAHEQNEEAKRKLREKAEAEKAEAEKNKGGAKPEEAKSEDD